jgi:hypothetical protein
MRQARHFVEWHGQLFLAEPLRTLTRFSSLPPVWAVSRGREFIGTLPVVDEETTKEFEVRCGRWIEELIGGSPIAGSRPSARGTP